MKWIFFIFSTTQLLTAQISLEKSWLGPRNELFVIKKDTIYWGLDGGIRDRPFQLKDGRIIVIQHSWVGEDHRVTTYPYRIELLSEDSLTIVAETDDATSELRRKRMSFIDASRVYDPSIHFDSLYFSGTGCFGNCPGLEISITSSGRVSFYGQWLTDPFLGSYVGTISQGWVARFGEILKRSRIENIPSFLGSSIDAPVYEIKLSYNGTKKFIRGSDLSPYNWPLLDMLTGAYLETNLTKVDTVYFSK